MSLESATTDLRDCAHLLAITYRLCAYCDREKGAIQ